MKISKGEYTRFTLTGRVQLIALYGEFVLLKQAATTDIIIFRLFDFFVALVTDKTRCNMAVTADPVTPELVRLYQKNQIV